MNYVAIMAGGIGSRFWPSSRTNRPKQFLDILGVGKSLIRLTFERFLKLVPAERIFIVTNGLYKDLVLEHLPELQEHQVLCEPSRNNTGPCVAYTAFKIHDLDEEANFIIAPSDAIILEEETFIRQLQKALDFTEKNDALVTLGIQPSRPDTGYGYIQFQKEGKGGVHKVRRFTEKPQLPVAREFLASGDYLWNAGIFIWKSKTILRSFQEHATEIYDILSKGEGSYNSPNEQAFIDQYYPKTPSTSVDYAILEKASNIYTLPSSFGWSDLGTWASLHVESEKDARGNAFTQGRILAQDVRNTLVRAPKDKLVVLKDLEDYIIVDEEDVLLIYPKSKEQEIKAITKVVSEKFGDTYI